MTEQETLLELWRETPWSNAETEIMTAWLVVLNPRYREETIGIFEPAPQDSEEELTIGPEEFEAVSEALSGLGRSILYRTFGVEDPKHIPAGAGADMLDAAIDRVEWAEALRFMLAALPELAHIVADFEDDDFFGSPEAQAQRKIDILYESIDLAVTSKNPDTAMSRFELAKRFHGELAAITLPDELWKSVDRDFNRASQTFPTVVVLNEAKGLVERGQKLKTPKGRAKYYQAARDLLTSAISAAIGETAEFERALSKVERQQ